MRMLKIIDLLLEEGRTTVSALSERLKLSTRQVRYDIECINSLHEKKQPLIETDNKGLLYAKDEEEFTVAAGFDTGLLVGLQDKIIWNVINCNRL